MPMLDEGKDSNTMDSPAQSQCSQSQDAQKDSCMMDSPAQSQCTQPQVLKKKGPLWSDDVSCNNYASLTPKSTYMYKLKEQLMCSDDGQRDAMDAVSASPCACDGQRHGAAAVPKSENDICNPHEGQSNFQNSWRMIGLVVDAKMAKTNVCIAEGQRELCDAVPVGQLPGIAAVSKQSENACNADGQREPCDAVPGSNLATDGQLLGKAAVPKHSENDDECGILSGVVEITSSAPWKSDKDGKGADNLACVSAESVSYLSAAAYCTVYTSSECVGSSGSAESCG